MSGSSGPICCAPTISGVVEHAVDLARAGDLPQAVVGEPDYAGRKEPLMVAQKTQSPVGLSAAELAQRIRA